MEIVLFNLSNGIESVQVRASSILNTTSHKFHLIYDGLLTDFKSTNIYNYVNLKSDEFIAFVSNIKSSIITQLEYLATQHYEVSKQSIYFGLFGLLVGSMFGLLIGSFYQNNNNRTRIDMMDILKLSKSGLGIEGLVMTRTQIPKLLNQDDILIQVKSIGVDYIDSWAVDGLLGRNATIPCRECSGIVVQTGKNVKDIITNDRVYLCLPLNSTTTSPTIGVCSSYILMNKRYVSIKPRNTTFESSSTLPYASIIFNQLISEAANLTESSTKNKRILIHFGPMTKNDGVGLYALQVLKYWGGRVTICTEEIGDGDEGKDLAMSRFVQSLKAVGGGDSIVLPAAKGSSHSGNDELNDLCQRIYDIVINTDNPELTPILQNFIKNPSTQSVIETFPKTESKLSKLFSFVRKPPQNQNYKKSLEDCRTLVEMNIVRPIISKSYNINQYEQAFKNVVESNYANMSHIGKSVLVWK